MKYFMCEDCVAGDISTYREHAESEAQKGFYKVNLFNKYPQFRLVRSHYSKLIGVQLTPSYRFPKNQKENPKSENNSRLLKVLLFIKS